MATALIVAAGSGERLGAGRPKALVEVAGRPLLQWSIDVIAAVTAVERIVVALPGPHVAGLPDGVSAPAGTLALAGGRSRSESVRLALAGAEEAREEADEAVVVVHDAARPLLNAELVDAVIAAARASGVAGAIAATPVTDTIKRARGDGPPLMVAETVERSGLWAAQTPQAFRAGALRRALAVADDVLARATDDSWLVERAGGEVVLVPAPQENIKVTTAADLALAELLLARRASSERA